MSARVGTSYRIFTRSRFSRQTTHDSFRRYASTRPEFSSTSRARNILVGPTVVFFSTLTYLYVTDTRASIHEWLLVPAIRYFYPDAEDAHHLGNNILKTLYPFGLHPRERGKLGENTDLGVQIFGHVLDNPIGTSAGIDKNAEIPDPLLCLGPGIVEVGGVTPYPQQGNPKPRVWRIPSQNAIINRYGLNSQGADAVASTLSQRVRRFARSIGLGMSADAERAVLDGEAGVPPGSLTPGRLMAVQVAKMKTTPDQDIEAVAQDYVYCVERLSKYADIMVVNVSSPNTPGLRSLQQTGPLTKILTSVVAAAARTDRKTKPAVMVKVSPDEDSDEQVQGICDAVFASGVDGIIVGNTTMKRPNPFPANYVLPSKDAQIMLEQGGYSGPQLFSRTVALVKKYKQTLDRHSVQESQTDSRAQINTTSIESASQELTPGRIEAGIERDQQRLEPTTAQADAHSKQPLIKIPARHTGADYDIQQSEPALSLSTHTVQGTGSGDTFTKQPTSNTTPAAPTPASNVNHKEKVIFATGGITNGQQALEVLNAGASVAMVYTALIYGGAGTITRIKREMNDEIASRKPPT